MLKNELTRANRTARTLQVPADDVGVSKMGVVNQQASNLDATLSDIRDLVVALEKRLTDVLLPTDTGKGEAEGIREASAPLADYLENLARVAGGVRDNLQDIMRRVAL